MGSLEKRLEALEAKASPGPQADRGAASRARLFEHLFHAHENARREIAGLEPLPDLPYTKEDYEDDLDTLETTIPAYRNSPGWQTEQCRASLDEWERDVRERIERNRA